MNFDVSSLHFLVHRNNFKTIVSQRLDMNLYVLNNNRIIKVAKKLHRNHGSRYKKLVIKVEKKFYSNIAQ